jgi:hypothetical protein
MAMLDWAKHELDLIGLRENSGDEMNDAMRKHIIHMVEEFAKEGHSGFSASYAIGILEKILKYEPLSPILGTDEEWSDVSEHNDRITYQNKRCSHVFKEGDGQAYDINGKVFWEWAERPLDDDEEGYPGTRKFKSYYTSRDSRVYITFPYTPKVEYVERKGSE